MFRSQIKSKVFLAGTLLILSWGGRRAFLNDNFENIHSYAYPRAKEEIPEPAHQDRAHSIGLDLMAPKNSGTVAKKSVHYKDPAIIYPDQRDPAIRYPADRNDPVPKYPIDRIDPVNKGL